MYDKGNDSVSSVTSRGGRQEEWPKAEGTPGPGHCPRGVGNRDSSSAGVRLASCRAPGSGRPSV